MKKRELKNMKIGEAKLLKSRDFDLKIKPKDIATVEFKGGHKFEMEYETNIDKKIFVFKMKS